MTNDGDETSLHVYVRVAGFMYLLVTAAYLVDLAVSSHLIVTANFAETARNVTTSERLYRISLSSQLIGGWMTILLGGALYALLKPVDRNLALFALLWRVGEAVLGGGIVIIRFSALSIYTGAAGNLGVREQEALVTLLRRTYSVGFTVMAIFFSLGSLIFFSLLRKLRFIPPLLSVLGMLGSVLVTMVGLGTLIFLARAAAYFYPSWSPIAIAEIATGLWLLIRGANLTYWNERQNRAFAL